MERVNKTLTIRKDQEQFIRDLHISLSRFVQDKLDEEMKKLGYESSA